MSKHFGEILGLEMMERGNGRVVYEMDLRPEHCNRHGSLHGGVMMAVLDAVGLWSFPPEDGRIEEAPRAATASFNCNFLRAALRDQTKRIRASGQMVKRGKTLYYATVALHSLPDDQVLAMGQGVYTLIPASKP
ncbi:MAG: PaaI family thioesterase [Burkholderiaceae bacterium]